MLLGHRLRPLFFVAFVPAVVSVALVGLVFAVGLGVFAIVYLGLGLVTTPGWVWLLLPVYGATPR